MRAPSSKACRFGSITTTPFTRTAPCAIVPRESSSPHNHTRRQCPVFRGQQHFPDMPADIRRDAILARRLSLQLVYVVFLIFEREDDCHCLTDRFFGGTAKNRLPA